MVPNTSYLCTIPTKQLLPRFCLRSFVSGKLIPFPRSGFWQFRLVRLRLMDIHFGYSCSSRECRSCTLETTDFGHFYFTLHHKCRNETKSPNKISTIPYVWFVPRKWRGQIRWSTPPPPPHKSRPWKNFIPPTTLLFRFPTHLATRWKVNQRYLLHYAI